jgi:hypothetical protein
LGALSSFLLQSAGPAAEVFRQVIGRVTGRRLSSGLSSLPVREQFSPYSTFLIHFSTLQWQKPRARLSNFKNTPLRLYASTPLRLIFPTHHNTPPRQFMPTGNRRNPPRRERLAQRANRHENRSSEFLQVIYGYQNMDIYFSF